MHMSAPRAGYRLDAVFKVNDKKLIRDVPSGQGEPGERARWEACH